MIIRFQS